MNIQYTDRVKQWAEGYPLIQRATDRLEEILGEDAGHVSGEWDRTEDQRDGGVATLRLRDSTGEVVRKFPLDELRSPPDTSFRLYRAWADLLHAGSKKMLDDLQRTGDGR